MKQIISFVGLVVTLIAAHILGWAIPILSAANLLWLLVKDELLVSWWTVGYVTIGFIVSIILFG